ncbi:MAG: hypothetical protein OIN66_16250 [Candidatus Methanoperedens sp.]|nr:hypothetical protein [Candidatus Methanoperedens sp.]
MIKEGEIGYLEDNGKVLGRKFKKRFISVVERSKEGLVRFFDNFIHKPKKVRSLEDDFEPCYGHKVDEDVKIKKRKI